MFKKNKKNLKFLIAALILSLPATLKVSAMENNPENLETNIETIQQNYKFCDDEYFNIILEKQIYYVLKNVLSEDIRTYLLNIAKYCKENYCKKNLPLKHYIRIKWELNEKSDLANILEKNFNKYNKNFIEKNIELNKNLKINFYYYEELINRIYSCALFSSLEYTTFVLVNHIKENKFYLEVIDSILENCEHLTNNIIELVEESLHTSCWSEKNKKYFNIPKKYETFEEYQKENSNISNKNEEMIDTINYTVTYNMIDNQLRSNIEEIFKLKGILE